MLPLREHSFLLYWFCGDWFGSWCLYGSEFKIDASYLSANVSIALSMESATRVYEVNCLVSEDVVQRCSFDMAKKLRLIDKVIIKGSKKPLMLYCVDMDYLSLRVDEHTTPLLWNTQQRYVSRQLLEAEKHRKWEDSAPLHQLFETCPELAKMRRRYTVEFLHVFSMGYQNYSEGEWQVARSLLSRTHVMLGAKFKDGPSGALLRFMEVPYKFEAPPKWEGVRELCNLDSL